MKERSKEHINIKVNGVFMDLSFSDYNGSTGNNSDTYEFILDSPSQDLEVGEESRLCKKLIFKIVGNVELMDFFNAINVIKRAYGEIKP